MLGVFTSVYELVLSVGAIAALVWVYRWTRRPAALVYLGFYLLSWLVAPQSSGTWLSRLTTPDTFRWLGSTATEQIISATLLTRIFQTTELLLFVWLVVSLVRWGQRRSLYLQHRSID